MLLVVARLLFMVNMHDPSVDSSGLGHGHGSWSRSDVSCEMSTETTARKTLIFQAEREAPLQKTCSWIDESQLELSHHIMVCCSLQIHYHMNYAHYHCLAQS